MTAILLSCHQEVERINVEELSDLCCMVGCKACPTAEDLIRVTTIDGKSHWCDSIEFEK